VFTGQHPGEFHAIDFLLQAGQQRPDFVERVIVVPFLSQLNQDHQVVEFAPGGIPINNDPLNGGPFLYYFLGTLVIVPEIGSRNFSFKFGNPFPLCFNVKDTPSAQRAFHAERQGLHFLHGT
jgi:hypothetical protein